MSDLDYTPIIVSAASKSCKEVAEDLKTKDVTCIDPINGLLRELVKIRFPAEKFKEQTQPEEFIERLGISDPESYGNWVYYPWARKLVRLPHKEDFRELRTARNKHKISRQEQDVLLSKTIAIVGLSTGHSIVQAIMLESLCGKLVLADFDKLELSNLNRISSSTLCLGQSKVVHTARFIKEIDPYTDVAIYPEGLSEDSIHAFLSVPSRIDLLVDECDSFLLKAQIRERCRELNIPVVMATSDRGLVDVERFDSSHDLPLLHGKITVDSIRSLSSQDPVSLVSKFVDFDSLAPRTRVSLLEIGTSISTWPQLGSDVLLGAATVGYLIRNILLGFDIKTQQTAIDLDEIFFPLQKRSEWKKDKDRVGLNHIEQIVQYSPEVDDSVRLNIELADQLVAAACLAPSGANMQPWHFYLHGGVLFVGLERSRVSDVMDPNRWWSTMSIGFATENIAIRACQEGLGLSVTEVAGGEPGVFCFRFEEIEPKIDELFQFIGSRHTNRCVASEAVAPDHLLSTLDADVLRVANLEWIRDATTIKTLRACHAKTDVLRVLNKALHESLFEELSLESGEVRQGLELNVLGLDIAGQVAVKLLNHPAVPPLIRKLNLGQSLETMSDKLFENVTLGLVTTESVDSLQLLSTGRALQRLWLRAERANLALQPLTTLPMIVNRHQDNDMDLFDAEENASVKSLVGDYYSAVKHDPSTRPVFFFRLFNAQRPKIVSRRLEPKDVFTVLGE